SAVVRSRPGPACGAWRRTAPARAAPPRRHEDVSFQEDIMNILLLISALAAPAANDQAIVVTAAREPVAAADSAASTTIFDQDALDDLSLPALPDLLRLSPGLSVATTGPRGTQTQVRIRGAEA